MCNSEEHANVKNADDLTMLLFWATTDLTSDIHQISNLMSDLLIDVVDFFFLLYFVSRPPVPFSLVTCFPRRIPTIYNEKQTFHVTLINVGS